MLYQVSQGVYQSLVGAKDNEPLTGGHMTPEDRIRELAPLWKWGGRGPITDPVDMEYRLGDEVVSRLTVVRLETAAALYRTLGEGFAKAAQIVSGAKVKG
jgi:hypothetical protein